MDNAAFIWPWVLGQYLSPGGRGDCGPRCQLVRLLLQVLRGYTGDRSAKPVFEGQTPFNVLGGGYQRPFELATLRLSNMIGILPKCALPKPSQQKAYA